MPLTKVSENSKRDLWIFLAVCGWALICVLSVVWVMRASIQVFDKDERIAGRFTETRDYLSALTADFSVYAPENQPAVLRILEPGCRCNVGSAGHWHHLQEEYPEHQFNVVEWSDLPDKLKALIPATPMAIYFDVAGNVAYAGPFSDALYCNSSNSLIEAYLMGEARMPFAPLETEGCFCSDSVS
jgi:hypothetical protein